MPEPKAQLVDPQGPIDVPGMQVTGVTTATGGFVGQVQGTATGFAATTYNLNVGIVTATKFQGNTTGNVSGLADDTNINVGIITSTSFTGDLVGNAAGLSTTTANINAGIMSATSFAGNFTGVASGITGTPNIVVGIMTGTLNGDGSSLTGIAATNWIANNVTANSGTTTINLSLGNVVKFTQTSNTTVSFANTGTSNIVTFIRPAADYTITWPSTIKWNGGSAPTLDTTVAAGDANVITLLTRDEGVTWYGWQTIAKDTPTEFGLFTWGFSGYGELGHNDRTARSSPTQIGSEGTWTKLRGNDDSRSFGGLKSDGTLWLWGRGNEKGGFGQNSTSVNEYSSPVQVPGTNWSNFTTLGHQNQRRNFAKRTDGTMWAWGANPNGELGLNNRTEYSSPVQLPGTTWDLISGGYYHSIGTKTDGTLWSWGGTVYGLPGRNEGIKRSSPSQIGSGTDWTSVSGGYASNLAVKTDGTLWSWGYNTNGQLGLNNRTSYSSPIQIPGTTWKNTQVSSTVSMATKTDGTLWMWGRNTAGQLGQNNRTSYSSPVQIPGTSWNNSSTFKYTAGKGNGFAAAIKTDGTLWAWGSGNYGNPGQNDRTNRSSPVQIPGTWNFVDSGAYSIAALKAV